MKIIYVINNLTFLVSHRLKIIEMLRQKNINIHIICGIKDKSDRENNAEELLKKLDVKIHRASFRGSSRNIIFEGIGFLKVIMISFYLKPNIIHGISPKGVLYGGLAGRILGIEKVILSFSGLGQLYSKKLTTITTFIQTSYETLLRFVMLSSRVHSIVQNNDDKYFLQKKLKVPADRVTLIKGSGVDLTMIGDAKCFKKKNVILFPARVIVEKGIYEFFEAATVVKNKYPNWKFIVAGDTSANNFNAVPLQTLQKWNSTGIVKILGHVENIFDYYKCAKIVCLPSFYREGLPLSLIEAAAHGCVVITSDSVGCRDAIIPMETGLLVPIRDTLALADAMEKLISDQNFWLKMSERAIKLAEEEFNITLVVKTHMKIYGIT
tara:strand:+ start:9556 stop:10695 length:1140 start_codon:yes stop_codon:yes gene_type:complete